MCGVMITQRLSGGEKVRECQERAGLIKVSGAPQAGMQRESDPRRDEDEHKSS